VSPLHFGDAAAELECLRHGCALVDRSSLARILSRGTDTLGFLNRVSTADLRDLPPGSGMTTVLTSAKGRIVERLFVHHLAPGEVLLVGGSGTAVRTLEHLRRYIFREEMELSDLTAATCQLTLLGPRASEVLERRGWPHPAAFGVVEVKHEGTSLQVLGQDGLTGEGASIVAPVQAAGALWDVLAADVRAAGGRPAGDWALESYRIERGLPASGHELTEEHNPLEAGLWEAVSFSKGCYVGQEVVARLRTYDKIARSLVALELPAGASLPQTPAPLFSEGREVGTLTSVVLPPGRPAATGLGYVKRREIVESLELQLGAPGGPTVRIVRTRL
jgi:folate-binding protein YgfZ